MPSSLVYVLSVCLYRLPISMRCPYGAQGVGEGGFRPIANCVCRRPLIVVCVVRPSVRMIRPIMVHIWSINMHGAHSTE